MRKHSKNTGAGTRTLVNPWIRGRGRRIAFLAALILLCNVAGGRAASGVTATPDDIRRATHFLENATFGPTAADITAVLSLGRDNWIAQQFALPESQMPDGLDTNQVRSQLFLNMANGADQLRQRVMFALSQTIVVSANKTGSGPELIPWVRLLSRNAFGNYKTLITEVTLSPTMGKYLDLAYSRKASSTSSPNENYPRELMQLFTIGLWELNMDGTRRLDSQNQPIPTYTQQTVREFSRALTGWTFPTMPGATPANSNPQYFVGQMEPRTTTHDTATKTLFNGVTLPANQTTTNDMLAVIDNVFQHANVPPFVATRLIRSLVTSNPSPDYIERVATVFANNGEGVRGDLKAVIRAVLTDPEAVRFSSSSAGRLKDPVLHAIGFGRALGARITDPNQFMYIFSNLSQRVLTPTTVFSFYSPLAMMPGGSGLYGPEFQIYPPALAVQRANFIYSILANWFGAAYAVDLAPFQAVASSPAALATKVDHALMFGRMSPDLRATIITATSAVPVSNTRERAFGAIYLAATSSEYSVSADNTGDGLASLVLPDPPAPPPPPAPPSADGGGGGGGGGGGDMPTPEPPAPPATGAPSAPANLQGTASGHLLGLRWQNTANGGPATSLLLDVTGAIVATLPLGVTDTFAFNGVPTGTYTFSVRAVNAFGVSAPSNPVTLSFPGNGSAGLSCSAAPQAPVNVAATTSGTFVSLTWQPGGGAFPSSYVVNVTGGFTGSFATAAAGIAGTVAPGTYVATVQAVNSCGTSAPAAPVTITVR